MTKNMALFVALITGTLSGQRIDHVSMELLKWHIPYVLKAYVPVEVYGDEIALSVQYQFPVPASINFGHFQSITLNITQQDQMHVWVY